MKRWSWLVGWVAVVLLGACSPPEAIEPSATPTLDSESPGSAPSRPGAARTAAPIAGFHVTDVVVRADPFLQTAQCPASVTFTGEISVAGGGGKVVYRWIRSDGATGRPVTVDFDQPRVKVVTTTWALGEAGRTYKEWQQIEILEPRREASQRASFTLMCVK